MRNPIDRFRARRLRRRHLPGPPRGGPLAAVVAVLLLAVVAAAVWLEARARARDATLGRYIEAGIKPADHFAAAGRSHRIIVLSDIAGAAGPKRLAADAIEWLALGPGLDAVALEVDRALQPWIDRYLETDPEDASLLVARPRALREAEGTAREYLDVYRRVWRLNRELGADRRIRIVAVDAPDWPPDRAVSPAQAVLRWSERDAAMEAALADGVFARQPLARVLVFADGLHALRLPVYVQTGGAPRVHVTPLARRLAERYPREVHAVLVDAPRVRSVAPVVAAYRGTRAAGALRREERPDGAVAVRIGPAFGTAADLINVDTPPGIGFGVADGDAAAADLADAWILTGS
jgi:hypothetical protein